MLGFGETKLAKKELCCPKKNNNYLGYLMLIT